MKNGLMTSIFVFAVMILTALSGTAWARSFRWTADVVFSFSSTNSSFDGQAPANKDTGVSKNQFGSFMVQDVSQFSFDGSVSCPAGQVGLSLIGTKGAFTYDGRKDILFYEAVSGTMCCALSSGVCTGQSVEQFSGGTGRFVGATGTFTINFTSQAKSVSSNGYGSFGAGRSTGGGTLILP